MTRKRFIKLLMGRCGLQRNETVIDVSVVMSRQKECESMNHIAKTVGISARYPLSGYNRAWSYYQEVLEYKNIVENEEI